MTIGPSFVHIVKALIGHVLDPCPPSAIIGADFGFEAPGQSAND